MVFAFSTPGGSNFVASGPELMNGRLAMLAFVAAAGGEIAGGKTVGEQLACEPVAVLATAALIVGGSVITYMANSDVGPHAKSCPLSPPPPLLPSSSLIQYPIVPRGQIYRCD